MTLAFDSYTAGYGAVIASPISSYSGDTAYDELIYTSSDPSIVSVSENGMATLLAPGRATVTITFPKDGNYQCSYTVTVEDYFDWDYDQPADMTLSVGDTKVHGVMSYSLSSGTKIDHVEWSSSDPAVAQVQATGETLLFCTVTAGSPGTATITCTVYFHMRTGDILPGTFSFDVTVE